ncbi:hypothetical protein RB200_35615 [Streptomyces sp. PmtG]
MGVELMRTSPVFAEHPDRVCGSP